MRRLCACRSERKREIDRESDRRREQEKERRRRRDKEKEGKEIGKGRERE